MIVGRTRCIDRLHFIEPHERKRRHSHRQCVRRTGRRVDRCRACRRADRNRSPESRAEAELDVAARRRRQIPEAERVDVRRHDVGDVLVKVLAGVAGREEAQIETTQSRPRRRGRRGGIRRVGALEFPRRCQRRFEVAIHEVIRSDRRIRSRHQPHVVHENTARLIGVDEQTRRVRHTRERVEPPASAVAPVADARIVLRHINQLQRGTAAVRIRGPRRGGFILHLVHDDLLAGQCAGPHQRQRLAAVLQSAIKARQEERQHAIGLRELGAITTDDDESARRDDRSRREREAHAVDAPAGEIERVGGMRVAQLDERRLAKRRVIHDLVDDHVVRRIRRHPVEHTGQ